LTGGTTQRKLDSGFGLVSWGGVDNWNSTLVLGYWISLGGGAENSEIDMGSAQITSLHVIHIEIDNI